MRSSWEGGELRARLRGVLEPPAGFDSLASVGVGFAGPLAIWTSGQGRESLSEQDVQPGWATFPRSRPTSAPAVALTAYGDSAEPTETAVVPALPLAFPHIQRLPNGSFLVVGSRCKRTPEGPELNALVVAPDGTVERQGCLGDGLEHVQVARDGTIWTGYFDEGIFGNFGWGGVGASEPLGSAGIVAWSGDLAKTWELDDPEGLVSDCYAFNVTEDAVWACPYMDFPLMRIADGSMTVWPTTDIRGARALLLSRDRVALIGSYEDESQLVVGHLTGDRFVEDLRTRLGTADGRPMPAVKVRCTGSVAHFFHGNEWSTFDLAELP